MEDLVALRRKLHSVAEPAWQEETTADVLQQWLAERGLEPHATGVAGHGLLYRVGDGPRMLLRADLDALPMEEQTGLEYAGKDAHHACGHDGHMAMLAGALVEIAEAGGSTYAIFQPSEENGAGAAKCLQDERIRDLDVDGAFAIHNLPGAPLGAVVARDGPAAVASRGVVARFQGATSHAAEPQAGRSPLLAVTELARSAPCISDDLAGGEPTIATVVHVEVGGPQFGTSPGRGLVGVTLRSPQDEAVEEMERRFRTHAMELAKRDALEVAFEVVEPFPATVNEQGDRLRAAARAAGLEVQERDGPAPWSEDFGHFTNRWGGALALLGSGSEQPLLHSAKYDFPDDLLTKGVALWTQLALR